MNLVTTHKIKLSDLWDNHNPNEFVRRVFNLAYNMKVPKLSGLVSEINRYNQEKRYSKFSFEYWLQEVTLLAKELNVIVE
jgi:hypothetical protein